MSNTKETLSIKITDEFAQPFLGCLNMVEALFKSYENEIAAMAQIVNIESIHGVASGFAKMTANSKPYIELLRERTAHMSGAFEIPVKDYESISQALIALYRGYIMATCELLDTGYLNEHQASPIPERITHLCSPALQELRKVFNCAEITAIIKEHIAHEEALGAVDALTEAMRNIETTPPPSTSIKMH